MTKPSLELAELQALLLRGLTHPDDTHEVVSSGEWIAPSATQSAGERWQVYQQAYFARLIDCLRSLFPALAYAVGDDDFPSLAREYLTHYPSRSYTLNRLGDSLPMFLESQRSDGNDNSWIDFLIELTRYEQAIDAVFDSAGIEESQHAVNATSFALARESPQMACFQFAPCVRLLACEYAVHDFYTAFKRGEKPAWPPRLPCFTLFTRRDYIVRRVPLVAAEFELLRMLMDGATLLTALEQVNSQHAITSVDISQWFESWGRLGLITGTTMK